MNKTRSAVCPSCGTRIYFHGQPKLWQEIVCNECGEQLEIVLLSPLKLDWSGFDRNDGGSDIDNEAFSEYSDNRHIPYDF